MLKNKIKNLLETEKMLKKNANKKRKKMAAAAAAAAEVKKEQPTGDVLKTENGTATADANGEAAKATPMEVEGEDLEDGDDDDDDDDEGPANPDDELNVQIVLDTYDDAAKKKWMEAQVEEVLEMKQKMRNQSTIVIEQQTKIANLEQNLKNAIQDLDVASLKRGSKGSKKASRCCKQSHREPVGRSATTNHRPTPAHPKTPKSGASQKRQHVEPSHSTGPSWSRKSRQARRTKPDHSHGRCQHRRRAKRAPPSVARRHGQVGKAIHFATVGKTTLPKDWKKN